MRITSPGTNSRAGGLTHFPSRFTRALIASLALRASMALPAWRSSQNPTTALAASKKQNNEKIRPVPDHSRKDHRHLDHPRDRTPKIGEKFQEQIGFLFFDLVRPILGQPFLRLGLTEAVRRRPQFFLHFRQGNGLQIVLRFGLRSRL